MPRHSRPHPVHSFRFWFLVLAVACTTAAWKLELIPLGGALRPASDSKPDAVELGEGSPETAAPGEMDVFLGQSEPEPAPEPDMTHPASLPAATANAPRVMPRAETVARSPFGAASPQFVTAPMTASRAEVSPVTSAKTIEPAVGVSLADAAAAESQSPPTVVQIAAEAPAEPATAPDNPFAEQPAEPAAPAVEFDFTAIDADLTAGTTEADVAAHRALSKLYWERPELRSQLAQRIEQTAKRIYFQPQPHYLAEYEVQPGDNLQGIAKKYSVSWQYLDRLNRIKGRPIKVGESLKVIKGPFEAVVDLSDHELTVHCLGHYVFKFPVGIGQDGSSPIGKFTVEDKVVNPRYDGPDGSIEPDDPANPIGERWISLGGGYGIHGTIDPDSIGKSESRGCIRMHNTDVEIVYDLLTVGSQVVIQR